MSDQMEKLLERPNKDQDREQFFDELAAQATKHGFGLVWVVSNALGMPGELFVLPANSANYRPPEEGFTDGYYLVWESGARIPARDVIKVLRGQSHSNIVREKLRVR